MPDQLQFIYVIRPTRLGLLTEGPTPQEEEILGRHFSYLKDLHGSGVLLLAGRTQDADETSFGIVILTADGEEEARKIMLGDPAVKEGVMTAEFHRYRVAIPV
jgi:uncharacterized protein YciI